MFRVSLILIALSLGLVAGATAATEEPQTVIRPRLSDNSGMVFGGRLPSLAKTVVVDTQLVLGPWGSGAAYNGQFQTPDGSPAWNGWTSADLTQSDVTHWHASTYRAVNGTYSAWCGDLGIASCNDSLDATGGYGNSWKEALEWRGTVANPGLSCTVAVTALANIDSEPGYDYNYLSVVQAGITVDLWTADGKADQVAISEQTTYLPTDYEGDGANEVVIQFRFTSDGGWSDEDCSWPTAGAIQLDDVAIALSNGTGYSHDFEDATLGDFVPVFPPGVGDFAKIWTNLPVLPGFSNGNVSPMVAFIDDGLVVPGTGGSQCLNWCYGPGGYIVNNTGGLAGPAEHIHNVVRSPRMVWPDPSYDGSDLSFDVWRHETLGPAWPGMFFVWSVRSTASTDSLDLDEAPWVDRNFVYYGGPDWLRQVNPVSDLIVPGAHWVQVQMGVYELGWVWGWYGQDGSPAPYFDNVRLSAFPFYGPSLSAVVTELPHDNFPEGGTLDLVNLGANNVRFDMGQPQDNYPNSAGAPGDSIVITVKPQRAGAALVGMPRMHWRLQRNPLFDPYRSAGVPDVGVMDAWQVMNNGNPVPDKFAFDFPDSGFLFPGDFLYYYFEASDNLAGEVQTITMPADTTGYSDFSDPMAYPPIYKLHALPTLTPDAGVPSQIVQPEILFWDDAGAVANRDEWYMAFRNLGLVAGVDYDIYYTNNPSSPMGHGLGGRATVVQIAGYEDLLYTSGVQAGNTLTGTDESITGDISNDVGLLDGWLQLGGKDIVLSGDDLAGSLARGDVGQTAFLNNWLGVDLLDENVLALIDVQTDPLVRPGALNPVFQTAPDWRAVAFDGSVSSAYYGGGTLVTGTKRYDGVSPRAGALRLAEFLDPNGAPGAYVFSAATLHERGDHNASVISFPYDFQSIWTPHGNPAKDAAPLPVRVEVLRDLLTFCGQSAGPPSDVPEFGSLAVSHYPNPFNPRVKVSYNLPRSSHLGIKIYDIRGRLIRNLVDGNRAGGPGEAVWNGKTDRGENAAAGVYFYELRTGTDAVVGKMVLVK